MSAKFLYQPLRPVGQQVNLVDVSTAGIHRTQVAYATCKTVFTTLIGRIADEHPVEDVHFVSFHPGVLYSEGAARFLDEGLIERDKMTLPADYAVWAASPKRLDDEKGFLIVAVQGLTEVSMDALLNKKDHL
ncbi:hypothetical protein J3R30DRAFT_3698383 [Lentinula aciculospora]|uniref:NAD(P)-binding protein n=1 Tax=Lentinula aciculospora TaxID=153920 RepID=A0A9W9DSI9_9AGAR|nr:hypothetical protein J3R30DRAFT_3698383 [Lentinula aciculospora]